MGIYFDPDNDMFQMVVKSEIYVDKTELMVVTDQLLKTEGRFLCVSRPRRFGKSMALNMLCAYYSRGCDSRELFSRYRIAGKAGFGEHINKYHVIQLNMRTFLDKANTIEGVIERITKEIVFDIEEEYGDLRFFDKEDMNRVLLDIYRQTKIPFVFLIDEWDAVFRVKAWGSEEQKRYLDFLRNLLKDQPYVALAYMTGILPIKKYGEHSALNMFTEYSMTESVPISEFMGFTKKEVQALSEEYGVSYDIIQAWYDGYLIDGMEIYNPRSVVQACMKKKFDSYWTKTETYEALKVYIEMDFDGLRDRVIRMIAGEKVPVNTEKFTNDMKTFASADDVLTLL
ncbi:MAG: AAA family ATPase, partial [Lachnospiraceae bacterium]|nr:AAA family ATPase [Lachnospiraceae bacterium]